MFVSVFDWRLCIVSSVFSVFRLFLLSFVLRRSVVDSVCVVFVLFCVLDVWSDVVDGTTTGVVGDVEGGGDDVARAGNGKLFVWSG